MKRTHTFAVALLMLAFGSCKKEVETFPAPSAVTDYLPLTIGKFIIYQLDSLVFTDFGRTEITRRFQEKQEVASQFTDNLGRPSFLVNRYLRDSAGTLPWAVAGNYYVTPTESTIEVSENNLRTVRLVSPVKKDVTWKGNRYLPFAPYLPLYDFRSDINFDLSTWEFYYESVNEPFSVNGMELQDVVTVQQADEESTENSDILVTGKTFAQDKYAKGIGLVYQQLIMREREPNTGGSGAFEIGFGVTRTMLEHN